MLVAPARPATRPWADRVGRVSSEIRFGFGENWRDFVANSVSPARVEAAVAGLRRICRSADLTGKVFLDIGCGSGLSSLAACVLGARRVVAFDFDENSVAASTALRAMAK